MPPLYLLREADSILQSTAQAPVFFGCPNSHPKEPFVKAMKIIADPNCYAVPEQALSQQPRLYPYDRS